MSSIHAKADALPEQLGRIDLNLLVAFDGLVRERSVTAAAERLGVTQSAMSHTLKRLRELFDDPLLVRGHGGMLLTPRAEALRTPIRAGLVALQRALADPAVFTPASARRNFCIASPDLFDALVLPSLLERMRHEAPGVDLRIIPIADRRVIERLETGEVDVAVVPQLPDLPSRLDTDALGLVRRTLLRDNHCCLLRRDHPALSAGKRSSKPRLSLQTYGELAHAMISPTGEGPGPVDRALAELGLQRRIALRIPYFHLALAIIAGSDLVLTAPRSLSTLVPRDSALIALPVPFELADHSVHLCWHQRFSDDPGHRWLRELLAALAGEVERRVASPKLRRGRRVDC